MYDETKFETYSVEKNLTLIGYKKKQNIYLPYELLIRNQFI